MPPNTPTPDERARLIEELRTEAGFHERQADLHRGIHDLQQYHTKQATNLTQAADLLARAGEDSARIDWLEANPRNIEMRKPGTGNFVWSADFPNLRKAIDSAISATQKEPG